MRNIYLSLLIMCITVYLIRVLPLIFLRREIRNRFIRSFLYYVPYVTLAVMTFPAILAVTQDYRCGLIALVAGVVMSLSNGDLFVVALTCVAAVLLSGFVF